MKTLLTTAAGVAIFATILGAAGHAMDVSAKREAAPATMLVRQHEVILEQALATRDLTYAKERTSKDAKIATYKAKADKLVAVCKRYPTLAECK